MHFSRMQFCRALAAVCISLPLVAYAAKVKEKSSPPPDDARAAELVNSALKAELAGDAEARESSLKAARALAPEHAPAHWHLGEIRFGDQWLPLDKATAAISKSPQYSLYRAKRTELDGSAKKEHALAHWCEKEGMFDRSQFHYARLMSNPEIKESYEKEIVQKLDLVMVDGQLHARAEVEEMLRDAAANDAAWRTWEKKFAQWQAIIEGASEHKRKAAHEKLQAIDDFHVTPLIESQLLTASDAWALELVGLLAKFPQPPATLALTRCAVLSPSASVREMAVTELKNRKLHDFVPRLLAGLTPQTKSQFLVRVGRDWSIDIQHQAVTEDAQRKVVTVSSEQHQAIPLAFYGSNMGHAHNPNTPSPVQAAQGVAAFTQIAQAQAESAMQRLRDAEQLVAMQNRLAKVSNANFYEALEKTTGQQLPREPAKWGSWWTSYNEVTYETPTEYYVQQYIVPLYRPYLNIMSCFPAGTPVYTECGPQPIDAIVPGDRVLSQNPNTGELAFKLVQNVTVRPPSKMRKVSLGGSDIVTTLGHPFWVNGAGWKMAKELQQGQYLHSLTGRATIDAIEELPNPDRAYNLVVADFNTYFVGPANVLVHDNLYRQPTTAKVPGLVEAVVK